MTTTQSKKLVLIDGNSLLYRAFYALPPLQNRRGEHTNAVYGFTTMLLKLLESEQPDYIAVAFDPPKPSFRVRIAESYKAQREKTPPELSEQVQRTREILEAMHIPVFEVEDFEADDVIGTLADLFSKQDHNEVTVVSGDADLLQLIGENVTVMLTKKGITQMECYDHSRLKEKYGLAPEQVIDFKALKGDPSDNIPGVPGIGEKTARSLLEEYSTLENIYKNIDRLKTKTAEKLKEYREPLYVGRDLVTLRRDVPIECAWEQCRHGKPDYDRMLSIFSELEFKSLVNKLKPLSGSSNPQAGPHAEGEQIKSLDRLESLLKDLGEDDTLALTVECHSGRPYWRQPVLALALAFTGEKGYYLDPVSFGRQEADIWQKLSSLRTRGAGLLVHNVKQWQHIFAERALKPPCFLFDTYLAAYLADPAKGGYSLPELLQYYLGVEFESLPGKKNEQPDFTKRALQLSEEARHLFSLHSILQEELKEQELEALLHEMEIPLASVLAGMEQQGMAVDADYLRNLSAEICRRLEELEGKIYIQAGEEFNINSPQQLSKILFDKLQLPEVRKTKTGRSTDARVLEELSYHHEIVALLLHYRQLAKLEGTYLSGLIELVDPQQQKIYTTFNQAATATGRLSSSDPNLQNIPIRLEEGRRIRRAFIPSAEDKILFAADYSQVELRILAHLSQDPILIEAFKTGQDIHRRTAAEVNNTSLEEVTPLMREKAKAVNFGIIYGSSDYGLAQSLKIPRAEAKAYIDSYFERYRGVREYMDRIITLAREQGYVKTMFNRRRYLPEIHSSNHNTRSFAERMALNTPIQGSAADILKLAMLKISKIIEEGGFKAAMLLQIHDELLFEIESSEIDFFAPMIKKEMEQACELSVPLQVDLKQGTNWEELKKI